MKKTPRLHYFYQLAFFSIGYFLAARWSLLLAFPGSNASPVWPPSGIAVAGLMLFGLRLWPAIPVAAFAANVVSFLAQGASGSNIYAVSFCIASGNTLEAVALVYFLQRFVTEGDWINAPPKVLNLRLSRIIKFILATLVAAALSSSIGTVSLWIGSIIPSSIIHTVNLTWWLGDVSGIFLVTPFLVSWAIPTIAFRGTAKSRIGLFITLLAIAGLSWILFGGPFSEPESVRPWIFLLAPALGAIVIGWGLRGVSAANLVVAIVAISAVANGKGLFSLGELNDALIQLDLLLILFSVVGQVLAADMDERSDTGSRVLQIKKIAWSWVGLFLAVAASMLIWHFGSLTTEKQIRDQFDSRVNTIRVSVTTRMDNYQLVLKGGAGLFNARGQVTHEEWRKYVESIDLKNSLQGVLGLGVSMHIKAAGLDEFIAGMRTDGYPDYAIHPAGKRPDYISVTYLEPFDPINQRAFGFDMETEPTRRAALDLARDTGHAAITGKLTLLQSSDQNPQAGFLFVQPIYIKGQPISTLQERRDNLLGYAYSPIFMSEFMSAVLGDKFTDLLVDVDDGETASKANLMFSSTPETHQEDGLRVLSRKVPIIVGQHTWLLTIRAAPAFLDALGYQRSSLLLMAGMLVGLSLFALMRTMTITQWRAEELAQQMRKAYIDAETRLESLVQFAGDAIIVADQDGRILTANPAASEMFGQSFDALKLRELGDLLHPRDRLTLHNLMARLKAGENVRELAHLTGIGLDRQEILITLSLCRWVSSGGELFGAIVRDITDLKHSEFKLRDNEAKLRGLFELSALGIALTDMQGKYIEFNLAFQNICGYPPEELKAIDYWKLTPEEYEPQEKRQIESLRKIGRYGPYEKEYIQKSGVRVPIRLNGVMMQLQGREYIWSIVEDISAQKIAEKALLEAKHAAELANIAKSAFLSNMSHEIRTPLNAILGLTQLVLESDLPAWQLDYLQKVYSSSQALLAILNDILDYSKIEAGKLDLEYRKFDIEKVLESSAALFSTQASRKGLELLIELHSDVPRAVYGDALRLSQIINNLVGNAVKFTEKGEIHLQVKTLERIEDKARIEFSVRDTGVGIAPDQAAQLFQAFTQADTSVTRKYGGTGLGLAISRRLVELMGGEITIQSVPDKGSTFRFTAMLNVDTSAGQATEADNVDTRRLAGLRVLLVDDQPTSIKILQAQIEIWKMHVTATNSGAEALMQIEKMDGQNLPFDLIISDWKMPGMDGIELIRAARALHTRHKIHWMPAVIMLTALNREQLLEEARGLGLSAVLTKPITPTRLLENVVAVCRPELTRQEVKSEPMANYRTKANAIRGARLLLVEDNATNRLVATEILKLAGFEIEIAEDGLQAVEIARRTSYDAILMDVQMPGIDGLEATRRLRATKLHRDTPILAMTAGALQQDREACLAAGMNEHVAKPIDAEELVETLVRWIPVKPFR